MNHLQATGAGATRPGEAPPLPAGHLLDGYRIVEVLGRGSFGTIYLARDPADGRAVSIKAYRPAVGRDGTIGDHRRDGFRREAEILARLRHPNIVRLHRFEPGGETPYMVLDHIDGASLDRSLADSGGRLDEATLRALLAPLLDALDHVHAAGFVHRDVAPGNIHVRADGRPVLIDFGAALPRDGGDRPRFSQATPGYAPLEQFIEGGAEGAWTDIYALAAVAYRAVAGRSPPPALDRERGIEAAPAVEVGRGQYAPDLLAAIDLALQPAAEARPQTIGQWRQALAGWLDTGPPAPVTASGPTPAPRRRAPLDDYPPTEEVTRVIAPVRRPPSPSPPPARAAAAPRPKRRSGAATAAWVLFVFVMLAAGLGAAGWFGWPLYLRYVKSEWLVDAAGDGDVVTIGEALATAKEGALIRVRPGIYRESLTMVRPVHLIGTDAEEGARPGALIAPDSGPCLSVTAPTGSVRGLAFRGGGPAGDAAKPTGAPVACVDLAGGSAVLEDNLIGNRAGPAVRVRDGADPAVGNNRVSAAGGPGILIDSGAAGTIRDNQVTSTDRAGMIVGGGATPHIVGNRIEGTGQAGVLYAGAAGGRFEQNEIVAAEASGIEVRGSSDPVVTGNWIEAAAEAGIYVYDGGRGRFDGNTIVGSAFSGIVVGAG
ncbi:MAG: right-handed parallel beta-helix repeat-containing protein, partial [Alphaproteobacteria bacterium]